VSLEEQLREEVEKQNDKAIEDIPWITTSKAKLALRYKDISDFYIRVSLSKKPTKLGLEFWPFLFTWRARLFIGGFG
jgi:hypothetical protein